MSRHNTNFITATEAVAVGSKLELVSRASTKDRLDWCLPPFNPFLHPSLTPLQSWGFSGMALLLLLQADNKKLMPMMQF